MICGKQSDIDMATLYAVSQIMNSRVANTCACNTDSELNDKSTAQTDDSCNPAAQSTANDTRSAEVV